MFSVYNKSKGTAPYMTEKVSSIAITRLNKKISNKNASNMTKPCFSTENSYFRLYRTFFEPQKLRHAAIAA